MRCFLNHFDFDLLGLLSEVIIGLSLALMIYKLEFMENLQQSILLAIFRKADSKYELNCTYWFELQKVDLDKLAVKVLATSFILTCRN